MAKTITPGFDEFFEAEVKEKIASEMQWAENRTLKYAENIEEVRALIDKAISIGKCAVDLETTTINTRIKHGKPVGKIVGIGLCCDPSYGLYTPLNHRVDPELNLNEGLVLDEMRRLCKCCPTTIYQNAKFDLAYLKNYGVTVPSYKNIEDTYILAHLYDAGMKGNELSLKSLARNILNQPMIEFKEITKGLGNQFDLVSPRMGYKYAAVDPVCTLDLYNFFMNQEIIKNQGLIYDLEKRVIFVVMEMESNYIKIDVEYLKGLDKKISERISVIEKEIHALAKRDFKLNSPQQLGKLLFDDERSGGLGFKYPDSKKTASGQYSTDTGTLEKIADMYPIVKKIIEYRGLEKVQNTYVRNLIANIDENSCIKLGFNQCGTDTGRFSSPGGSGINEDGYSGCNVQSIPKRPDESNPDIDIRKGFVARPGKTLVAIDYENEEMRIATNLSTETAWIDAVNAGVDFHTKTGAIISGKDIKDVTSNERALGKCVAKGTLIASEQGWIPIENLKKGDKVVTHKGKLKSITNVYDMGIKPGVEIITKSGQRITCGLNHRFITTENKWIRAEDLKIGDIIKTISCENVNPKNVVKKHFNIWDKGNNNISTDNLPYIEISPLWARLIGYILGDGSISENYVNVVCSEDYEETKNDIFETAQKLGLNPRISIQRRKRPDGSYTKRLYRIQLGSRVLVRFFKSIGFAGKRKTKYGSIKIFRVPRVIFESPKEVSREFLTGLFETDGYVSKDSEVSVCTKDKEFAEDIILLLSTWGIKSTLSPHYSKKYKRYYYNVYLGVHGAKIFEREIGFVSSFKKDRLYSITHKKLPATSGSYKIKWETEIKEINSIKSVELMDLTVEKDHTYVAQGLVTHNTTNFLALYLGGPFTLASNAKISVNEAKRVLAAFFAGVPNLNRWIKAEIVKARKTKTVKTLFGRIRPLEKFYTGGDHAAESHGDRCAINTQIQGLAADLMKAVMSKMYNWIHFNNLQDDIKILVTMHDELVFEITTDKLELYVPEIAKIMMLSEIVNDQLRWPIPLTVDIKYGLSWRVKNKFFNDFPHTKERLKEPLLDLSKLKQDTTPANPPEEPPVVPPNETPMTPPGSNESTISETAVKTEESGGNLEVQESSGDKLIYTIETLHKRNVRWLNDILIFLQDECKRASSVYKGPKKKLVLKDSRNNALLVEEPEVFQDSFLTLVRFFGI